MTAVIPATAVLLVLAVAWKLYQLLRAPHDRTLLAVTLCIGCRAVAYCLGIGPLARSVDAWLGAGTALLVSTILVMDTAYWLMSFYLYSVSGRRAGRRAQCELALLIAAVAVITWATLATPADLRALTYGQADLGVTHVAVVFIVPPLYLMYAFTTTLWWTWRYVRMTERSLSAGLRLTALALTCMLAANAVKGLGAVIRWRGGDFPVRVEAGADWLLALGLPLFAVGLSYFGIVNRLTTVRIWHRHRRAYRRLRSLWAVLHDAYPENALRRPAVVWREALDLRAVHRRYYRRVIECRDGLVRISPQLAAMGVGERATPQSVARLLPSALQAQAAGGVDASRAVGVMLPPEDSLDADVRQLVQVSCALAAQRGAGRLTPAGRLSAERRCRDAGAGVR